MAGRNRSGLDGYGPPVEFARCLRETRDASGLTLRQMAIKSGYSHSALSKAESGRAVPSWELTAAFVQTCGQDPALWRRAWEMARAAAPQAPAVSEPVEDVQPPPFDDEESEEVALLPARRGRRKLLLALGAAGTAAISAVSGWMGAHAGSRAAVPSATSAAVAHARDYSDPYEDRCKADEKQLDRQPVYRSGGSSFGTIMLMYSPACEAAWGYLEDPNTTAWTSHIIAHRIPGNASAPSQFGGDASYGSWGNVLSTQSGCVYIEAYIVDKRGEGPHARTACIQPAAAPSQPAG